MLKLPFQLTKTFLIKSKIHCNNFGISVQKLWSKQYRHVTVIIIIIQSLLFHQFNWKHHYSLPNSLMCRTTQVSAWTHQKNNKKYTKTFKRNTSNPKNSVYITKTNLNKSLKNMNLSKWKYSVMGKWRSWLISVLKERRIWKMRIRDWKSKCICWRRRMSNSKGYFRSRLLLWGNWWIKLRKIYHQLEDWSLILTLI